MGKRLQELAKQMGWNDEELQEFIREIYKAIHEGLGSIYEGKDIDGIFRELGIPTNLLGYKCLHYAIQEATNDMTVLKGGLTKILYPKVAEKFGITVLGAERAMRTAIEAVWFKKGSQKAIEKYFGSMVSHKCERPTNGQFISTIAMILTSN